MRTKIILEESLEETVAVEFTLKEIYALFKIFKRAPFEVRHLFGEQRYNELYRKLGNLSNTYIIENELQKEYSQPKRFYHRTRVQK